MKDLPYYRLWVKDFDTNENVRLLNLPEAGLYLFALNHAWVNDGLPGTPKDIARALKIPGKEFSRYWPRVSQCFSPGTDGRLRNKRQEEERTEAKTASERGRANVQNRYKKATTVEELYVSGSTRAVESVSVSGSVSEKTLTFDDFHKFHEVCEIAELSLADSDLTACRVWWVRLSIEEKLAAVQGIKARVAAGEFADSAFRPLPQNYLRQKLWQRPIRERRDPGVDKQHAQRNEVLELTKAIGAMRGRRE